MSDSSQCPSSTYSLPYPPKEYEEIIRKLESEVRNHIKIEQQMKIHIDTLVGKIEEIEKSYKDEMKAFQRKINELEVREKSLLDLVKERE